MRKDKAPVVDAPVAVPAAASAEQSPKLEPIVIDASKDVKEVPAAAAAAGGAEEKKDEKQHEKKDEKKKEGGVLGTPMIHLICY